MSDKLCYIVKSSHVDTDDWDWVLGELIKGAVQERGFRCEVGVPLGSEPHLIEHHVAKLIQADLVVIDATGCDDPKVFYQLGVRHARANHTILIAQDEESLKEDVTSYHKINYSERPQDFDNFRQKFAQVLDKLAASPQNPDNVVQKYLRGEGRAAEQAREMREQAQLIAQLQDKIEILERELKSNPPPPRRDDRIKFKRV